jgi:hypothetical protein
MEPSPHSVGSPPPVMFALQIWSATGQWMLGSILYDRAEAEYRGEHNRMRRPWRVFEYRLVRESDEKVCVLCGEPFDGFGNNPEPLIAYEAGRCCNDCNTTKVIPARLMVLHERLRDPE